jgi:hypothetical protein
MKIGEAHRTHSSSLYSANTIGEPMHPAPIGVAGQTRKKTYWRTVPGQLCLLAEGTSERQYIGAPMPSAPIVLAHKKNTFVGPQNKQSARLSLQSSELGPPPPLKPQVSVPPLVPGGHTCLQERGWVGSQYEGTDTVVL